MKVYRFEIPEAAIAAGLARMKAGEFTSADIREAASPHLRAQARATPGLVGRLAARLIERHRTLGDIVRTEAGWRWIERETFSAAPIAALASAILAGCRGTVEP